MDIDAVDLARGSTVGQQRSGHPDDRQQDELVVRVEELA